MKGKFFVLLLLSACLACNHTKQEKAGNATSATKNKVEFDKAKWKTKNNSDYPFRNDMLPDLIDNKKVKGLTRNEVFDLLGQPDRIDSSYLFYLVAQERWGFFPLHTKTLVIKLSANDTVEWRKIHE